MLEVSMEELKKAVENFHKLTNITIVLYDDKRKVLYSYPEKMCDFCATVRTNKKLYEKCIECDNRGFDQCEKTRMPYIYKCHMKLYEAIAPIIENGVIIGYMMMGQILEAGTEYEVKMLAEKIATQYKLNSKDMFKSLDDFKAVDPDFINSATNIMSMCACYLYHNKIIKQKSDLLVYQLRDYADSHFTEKLSVKNICEKLYISKSKLYSLSVSAFGMGISEYILKKRIEEAKKLLKDTDKSISAISEEVGFGDANYFTRMFKKCEHITPGKYRKEVVSQ